MARNTLILLSFLTMLGCSGDEEIPKAEPFDGTVSITGEPADVLTGWPCPPFDVDFPDQSLLGDSDGDNLTDCQEQILGTQINGTDTDGDGVPDNVETGTNLLEITDTDGDGTFDVFDTDDDGDGCITANELGDSNEDGIADYVQDDVCGGDTIVPVTPTGDTSMTTVTTGGTGSPVVATGGTGTASTGGTGASTSTGGTGTTSTGGTGTTSTGGTGTSATSTGGTGTATTSTADTGMAPAN